jgi:hypothetical protein
MLLVLSTHLAEECPRKQLNYKPAIVLASHHRMFVEIGATSVKSVDILHAKDHVSSPISLKLTCICHAGLPWGHEGLFLELHAFSLSLVPSPSIPIPCGDPRSIRAGNLECAGAAKIKQPTKASKGMQLYTPACYCSPALFCYSNRITMHGEAQLRLPTLFADSIPPRLPPAVHYACPLCSMLSILILRV